MTAPRRIRTTVATTALVAGLVVTATGAAAQDRACAGFVDQAAAQAALDAAGPGDPLGLDADRDGVACEALLRRSATPTSPTPTSPAATSPAATPSSSARTSPTSTSTSGPASSTTSRAAPTSSSSAAATSTSTTPPTSVGEGTYRVGRDLAAGVHRTPGGTGTCSWFRLADDTGRSSSVIATGGGTGALSVTVLASDAFVRFSGTCRWTRDTAAPTGSSAAPTSSSAPADDRDCADFATQAQAQAALTADATDPDRLDDDDDGIACEERFGTQGRQVAVVPVGGVATGGRGTP